MKATTLISDHFPEIVQRAISDRFPSRLTVLGSHVNIKVLSDPVTPKMTDVVRERLAPHEKLLHAWLFGERYHEILDVVVSPDSNDSPSDDWTFWKASGLKPGSVYDFHHPSNSAAGPVYYRNYEEFTADEHGETRAPQIKKCLQEVYGTKEVYHKKYTLFKPDSEDHTIKIYFDRRRGKWCEECVGSIKYKNPSYLVNIDDVSQEFFPAGVKLHFKKEKIGDYDAKDLHQRLLKLFTSLMNDSYTIEKLEKMREFLLSLQ